MRSKQNPFDLIILDGTIHCQLIENILKFHQTLSWNVRSFIYVFTFT